MCITKTEAYWYKERAFPTELEAIDAALTDIGQAMMKEHHSDPFKGIMAHGHTIGKLMFRRADITAVPGDVDSSGTQSESMMVSPYANPTSDHYPYWQEGFGSVNHPDKTHRHNPYPEDNGFEHVAWQEGQRDALNRLAKPWEGCTPKCNLRLTGGTNVDNCSCGNWPKRESLSL